jgi:hypothetical protein
MEIFIDFDGTISPSHFPDPLDESPFPNCVETIRRWKDGGHTIVIYSCRGNPDIRYNTGQTDEEWLDSYREMLDYLKKHRVPYDRVDCSKPFYKVLICDRTLQGGDRWAEIADEVAGKKYGRSHKHN